MVETERDSEDSQYSQYSQNLTSEKDDTEQSILEEEDTNEQQVQVNNTNIINDKTSFIWNHLEKLPPSERHKKRVRCLVLVSADQVCGHIMGTDGSTGNFIQHLAKHHITRDTDLSQNSYNETQNCGSARKISWTENLLELL